ncbi:MAG TPA: hypothetical protein EYG03_01665 [Planctomycetes bacterium]|nr:hypothetical protein [Fuerstiella sp.]HIK90688.1 hypothetical protein [Planctomycetota bacterium]
MFVRIHSRAYKYGNFGVLASARQKEHFLSYGKTPGVIAIRGNPGRDGTSSSGGERTSRGGADARSEPYRPPVHDGGNVTAKALLIGGCVLAVGVLALAAVRFSQVSSADAGSSDSATAQGPVSENPGSDVAVEDEPDESIKIPEIAIPEDADDPQAATPKRDKRVRVADASSTDVVSPGTEEDDASAVNSAELPEVTVPDISRIDGPIAVPKYNHPDPYAEVQTVDLISDVRGRRVMASLNEICVHIIPFAKDVRGDVSAAVSSGVRGALERCQLRYRGGISEPIVLVHLDVVRDGDVQSLSMTATLLVNRDSRMLKVWQKTADIGAVTDQALRKGILPPNLNRGVSGFFTELRSQFVDVRRQFAAK